MVSGVIRFGFYNLLDKMFNSGDFVVSLGMRENDFYSSESEIAELRKKVHLLYSESKSSRIFDKRSQSRFKSIFLHHFSEETKEFLYDEWNYYEGYSFFKIDAPNLFDLDKFCSLYSTWFDYKGIPVLLNKYTSYIVSRTMEDSELAITGREPLSAELISVLEEEPRLF
jgi:hypothetical protein